MTTNITSEQFDLCVIGAGPGGYVSAIRAAQLGLKVVVVEANHLGGICLNWGCIPTKALLKCSEINHLLHNLSEYGFSAKEISFDFEKIISRSRGVAAKLSSGIASLLKKNKVTVIDGFASFVSKNKIAVHKDNKLITEIKASYTIIATGARARVIKGMEPDGNLIWSYKEAMTPKSLPKSLIVVGSGAIGVEFASFYKNMGSDVTLIESQPNILPIEDKEISKLAHKSFEKQGIKIHSNANLKSITKGKNQVTADVEVGGKTIQLKAEKIIMAVGITANTENLKLEKTQVKTEQGRILTNQFLETNDSGIFAIGDVAGAPWLAHKASHEGVIAAEVIAARNAKYDLKKIHAIKKENIPGCTYCMPQIASVGLTEEKALALGLKIKIGRFPYIANGKAMAIGESEGLIKVIFEEKTGELLGAHMIGAEVTEMIQGYVIGKQAELTEQDFIDTIFAHPTMSEMMHEAVLDAFGKVIHY